MSHDEILWRKAFQDEIELARYAVDATPFVPMYDDLDKCDIKYYTSFLKMWVLPRRPAYRKKTVFIESDSGCTTK